MKSPFNAWTLIILFAASLGLAKVLEAEEHNGPCQADVKSFCKDVKPGGGSILKCLKENEAKLSQACRDNLGKWKAEMNELHQACQKDREALCKDVKPGGGRIMHCLKQNEAKLSPACKAEIEKAAAMKGKKG